MKRPATAPVVREPDPPRRSVSITTYDPPVARFTATFDVDLSTLHVGDQIVLTVVQVDRWVTETETP